MLRDEEIKIDFSVSDFPHPQSKTSSLESLVAPSYIPYVMLIPMVLQIAELVADKEKKLRSSLECMVCR